MQVTAQDLINLPYKELQEALILHLSLYKTQLCLDHDKKQAILESLENDDE